MLSPDAPERRIAELKESMARSIGIIIPTYPNAARLPAIQHSLHSLQGQAERINRMDVYVVYNGGADHPHRRELNAVLEGYRDTLRNITVIDAAPSQPSEQSPAFARNTALRRIFDLGKDQPERRTDLLYFHDDDSAVSSDALAQLNRAVSSRDDVVAASPEVRLVPELDSRDYRKHGPAKDSVLLPTVWRGGEVDVMGLIGMSSDVTTRTSASLVRTSVIRTLGSAPFVMMPRKSAEDIIFGTAITRNGGRIMRVPSALSFDKMRDTQEEVRRQKAPWGEDHVHLVNDMTDIGVLHPQGTHVLLPTDAYWQETVLPEAEGDRAYVINPEQLLHVLEMMREDIGARGMEQFLASFSALLPEGCGPAEIEAELGSVEGRLRDIVRRLEKDRPAKIPHSFLFDGRQRTDDPRQSRDSQIGQLMGDVFGNIAQRRLRRNPVLFYGVRQYAHILPDARHA